MSQPSHPTRRTVLKTLGGLGAAGALAGGGQAVAHVEHEHMGAGTHEKYLQVADELAERFGVSRATAASGHGCGCHHG